MCHGCAGDPHSPGGYPLSVVSTPAIVLATLRYRESSKIVRLATLELGVLSVIAKGALRPKSRFGASLQVLSEGSAILHYRDRRELQTLASFDPATVRLELAENLAAFATASVLAEMMVRFSPSERHPESYHLLRQGLDLLEASPPEAVDVVGLRLLWRLVSVLGFAPEMMSCVRDGAAVPTGAVVFSPEEGGVLCEACAGSATRRLPAEARADLHALLDASAPLPLLDDRHASAHRRLLTRYVEHHLAEGAQLPAMAFWLGRVWEAA